MSSLPLKARWFLIAVYATAACAIPFLAFEKSFAVSDARSTNWQMAVWELLGLATAAAFAGSKKVRLFPRQTSHEAGSMSLGFVVIFITLLRFGPPFAIVIGTLTTLLSCMRPKRHPYHQLFFNVGINFLQTLISSEVFVLANGGSLELSWSTTPQAVLISSLSFFFINTGAVATVIGLATNRNIWKTWVDSFLFTAPSYFIGAGVATIVVGCLGDQFLKSMLLMAPVASLIYLSYKGYADRTAALLKSKDEMAELYLQTVRSLALAIDAKDQYTHKHIVRVQQYAVATARQMGLSEAEVTAIEMSALLHDIGKLGVPEYVLLKPGRLTEDEFAKIREHPRIGADILDPVHFPWPVLPGVKHHHERWDGSGYPDGLKAEDIPLQGRILAVADVYDALTSDRSYRNAWPHEKAKAEIARTSGAHFDPHVAECFLAVVDSVVAHMAEHGTGFVPAAELEAAELARGASDVSIGGLPTPTRTEGRRSSRADVAVRDIQRASSELWALYEVAQTLSASVSLQDTLDILTRKLEAILPGAACVFLITPSDGAIKADGLLEVRAAVGPNHEIVAGCRVQDDESLSARVLRSGVSFLGAYDPQDLAIGASPDQPWIPLRSALIVPVIHQGTRLGTINIYHSQEWAFGPQDQQFLERIAERAALAVWNGLLFDRTRTDALTDPLTGLANVRRLTTVVEELCLKRRTEGDAADIRFALLCLDLDAFKPINDNFGHQKGDDVLRSIADIFQLTVGEDDLVARYGGDEFLIVLRGADKTAATLVMERLNEAVARYDPGLFHPRLGPLRLSASIGLACFPADGEDVSSLLSVADADMYRLKAERKLGRLVGGEAPLSALSSEPSFGEFVSTAPRSVTLGPSGSIATSVLSRPDIDITFAGGASSAAE